MYHIPMSDSGQAISVSSDTKKVIKQTTSNWNKLKEINNKHIFCQRITNHSIVMSFIYITRADNAP